MRLRKPRIAPVDETDFTPELREILPSRPDGGRLLNIFTTLARYPKLLKRWLVFAGHVLGKSKLEPRARELLILRTGFLCRAEYEWAHHVVIARGVGFTEEEIRRVALGPEAPGWEPFDAMLLRAADELHDDQMITDGTWAGLSQKYGTEELMDVVFTVGEYTLVSMALNAFGVQPEEGLEGFPP
ncbi:MAG TPA: carboxymuconolactone decarboxylase family protein [Polyangiaceae bacterium]|nr:carboxymuconolactone decarboxylase family protein [Polyangiaceae bacterium]